MSLRKLKKDIRCKQRFPEAKSDGVYVEASITDLYTNLHHMFAHATDSKQHADARGLLMLNGPHDYMALNVMHEV